MNIKFSPPDIKDGEVENVVDCLNSGWITTGPKAKEFERRIAKYCSVDRAVVLNSATACLELCLRILGIGAGDEVITSSYTYSASASVINHVGAKIVLVDVAKDGYFMDLYKFEAAITSRTKAIIPIDIAGVPCDYDALFDVVNKKKNLFEANTDLQKAIGRIAVIDDAAHSFGALYKNHIIGGIADFTCFSFHAVKNLTTAEGGAVVWKNIDGVDNAHIYNEFMLWSLHGQTKDALSKTKIGSWEYDIDRLGYKFNMTDMTAALGLAQLERYDGLLKKRKAIIEYYIKALDKLDVNCLEHFTADYVSSGHLFLVRINGIDEFKRNKVVIKMAREGIATNVHYKPLPMHTAYKKLGFDIKEFANSYNQYKNEITLPLHTLLTDAETEYVAEKFINIIKGIK